MLLEMRLLVADVVVLGEWAAEVGEPDDGFQLVQAREGNCQLEVQAA